MTASDPFARMVEDWSRSQRQLWELLSGGARDAGGSPDGDGEAGPLDGFAWIRKAADLWGRDEGILGRTVGNLLSSQEMLGRSVELLAGAWGRVVPELEAGQDWQPALRRFLDQWVEQVVQVPEQSLGATREAAQLVNSLMWDWSPVLGPWLGSAWKSGLSGDLGAALLKSSEGFDRLLAMEQEFEPAIGGLGEIPRAGLLRERNAKLLLAMDAVEDLRKALAGYQALVARGLAEAVERTIRHVIGQAEAGTPVQGVRDMVRTWFRIADQTLMHTFSSPEFIAAQNEVAAASMDHKIRQRELLGMFYEALEIPTRSELDDLYRTLHDLKRELRMLRRESARPARGNRAEATPETATRRSPRGRKARTGAAD